MFDTKVLIYQPYEATWLLSNYVAKKLVFMIQDGTDMNYLCG